jgi:NAD(P)H dehydrogenase (quinone)
MAAKIAVVYHSGYGHTAVVAEHVAKGASDAGAEATLYKVEDFPNPETGPWEALAAADAIIFGAPTYMGSVSAPMKAFMDASSKAWYGQKWKDKLAAGFTNSASWSGDKLNSLIQLSIFAAQHGMLWVPTAMMPGHNSSTTTPENVNRIGSFLGVMAQSNADQGPDLAPPQADRKTAEVFGARLAEIADRWAKTAA